MRKTENFPLLLRHCKYFEDVFAEDFLCPRDDSQEALRFAPVCPSVCLSVRPFVLLYGIEFV